ncbi:MAG: hypothetical protein IH629_08220, partial [Thermoleophilia bacterium]|nr:hypothetical protein [Thermoleophilia bacterium]
MRREMAHIVYVGAGNEAGRWDGCSWATAFQEVWEGLDAAEALVAEGGARPQGWVARGVYKPTAAADRSAAFRLRRGVDLYGGFRGGEAALDE